MEGQSPCSACWGDGSISRADIGFSANSFRKLLGSALLTQFLKSAMDAGRADYGNIQLFDSANNTLHMASHSGFKRDFLDYFAVVQGGDTACGTAMKMRQRIVVPDVRSAPIFQGRSGVIMLQAKAVAVQSTPLISSAGQFLGVLSTHYREAGSPGHSALHELDRVALHFLAEMECRI